MKNPMCLLRWVLAKGDAEISCSIAANPDASFDLRVDCPSSPEDGFEERFERMIEALGRHAEIAHQLRDSGWLSTDHLDARTIAA